MANRIVTWAQRRARASPILQDMVSGALQFLFGNSFANKTVTPMSAMQLSAVYACVRVIAETMASLPLKVLRIKDYGAEEARDHPLYRLLHDEPNEEMTSFTWRETTLTHLLLWGNAYSQIVRNRRGTVIGIWPLLPDHMEVDRDDKKRLIYTYTKDGVRYVLNPDEVLHIPALGFDGVMGYSPIAMERNTLGLALAAEEHGSRFFGNGACPAGVLTYPSKLKDVSKLRNSWMDNYGGSQNAGKVAVLEEGTKFQPLSVPNADAQYIETRKFQVAEICRIFRMQPHMIGDLEHATFSNVENQDIAFAKHTIAPWAARCEQALNRALFLPEEKATLFVTFNVNALERGAYTERMTGYATGIQNGWLSPNDVRRLENMNLIPDEAGGNTYRQNGNMIPLTDAGGSEPTSGGKEETDE